jgi:hypothetical protein
VFLQVLGVCCVLQFRFPPTFLGFLAVHLWGAVVISRKDGFRSGEKLDVLYD